MEGRTIRFLVALLIPLLVASPSLGGTVSKGRMPALPGCALPRNVIHVPLTRQATEYTCGVAALQSVLGYWGEDHREDELAKGLKSNTVHGTGYKNIADFAKQHGYSVGINKGMTLPQLFAEMDQRRPVICLIQAWPDKKVDFAKDWDDGHYVVAVGYDSRNVYFMDPSTLGSYTYIPRSEFLSRWHDTDGKERLVHFGMTVFKTTSPYSIDAVKPLN
jgi:predicted double-glycine peptidase